ncbi:hypothetical protein KSAC_31810 (plasmid) [Komagataeibacter saccharivorans]|uniref:autotransporter outer membrane beta-barrel domain-containing protein n=1 Tax=Komagataeibacter saccharivorans TaxID=265959 RepID=UPI00104D5A9D|nr:autotransporter domain-containing protein [Komagataeibacter saccharivorans]QBL95360.1 hypothetical protein KSAC_31810 [Komagataeibacter saccharivorans]
MGGTTTNSGTLSGENATFAAIDNTAGTATLDDSTAGAATNAAGATFSATGGTLASAVNSGTMTLGAGNTVSGDVTNSNGTLTLDGDTITGTLAANGGTFDVTSNNATAGSLAGAGNGTLDGTLTLANAKDTYSGVASGQGGLTVSGGTETLTGTNTYTGATTVSGGTLQLGNGGTTGDVADSSAIHDNGTLVADRSNTLTLSQTIDGTGSLIQKGAGTTILTGANTYTGVTTVSGGTLVGTTSSFGSGNIVNHAAFTVDQDTDGTLANVIEGDGSFTKTGSGLVNIDRDNTGFTGATDVDAGTLSVDGLLSNSTVTVNNGATLSGTGTVGSTTVVSGGTISPAGSGSIGTLNVNGDLAMSSGSVLSAGGTASETGSIISVNNKNYSLLNSDLVKVTGRTTISGGMVTFEVSNGGNIKYGQAYNLLTSGGGVSGRYDSLNTNLTNSYTFLSPSLFYTANDVDILLQRNNTSFSEPGDTRNQHETGRGMDHLPAGNPVVQAMEQLNGADARKALDALSGEIHASARTAMIEDAFFVREAALDRLAFADCDGSYVDNTIRTAAANKKRDDGRCYSDRAVFWGEAYGSLGRNFGNGNAATMNHTTAGFIMGVDTPVFETGRVGALVGYGSSTYTTSSGRDSSGQSNNVTLGVYGGNHWGNLYLSLGASYTWNMMNTRRTVMFDGYQGNRLSSSYLGGTSQGFGELGYKIRSKTIVVEPFARVAYVNMMTNAFHEHGGPDALDGRKTDTGVTFSTFGFRASQTMRSGNTFITPHIMVGYRHGFGLTIPTTHEIFAAAGAGDMDIAGVPLAADSAVVNAGFSIKASDRLDMGLSYVGQYGVQAIDNGVRFRITYKY